MKSLLVLTLLAVTYSNGEEMWEPKMRSSDPTKTATADDEIKPYKLQKTFAPNPLFTHNDTTVIASLREAPSELHLCSASFIRKWALITTSRCIYGRTPEGLYVHTASKFQAEGGVSVPVKKLYAHPFYEAAPQVNDIGMIISDEVNIAFVQELPLPWQTYRGKVTAYQWMFSSDLNQFYLQEHAMDLITNAKCSLTFRKYVECKYICIGNARITLGSMDQGMPISGTVHNKTYILGLFNRDGHNRDYQAEQYEKVYPHVDWINQVLDKNEHHYWKAATPPPPISENPVKKFSL